MKRNKHITIDELAAFLKAHEVLKFDMFSKYVMVFSDVWVDRQAVDHLMDWLTAQGCVCAVVFTHAGDVRVAVGQIPV